MKKLIYVFIIFLMGCNTQDDYFNSINDQPKLFVINPENVELVNEIKDSLKLKYEKYQLNYQVKDDHEIFMDYDYVAGSGTVQINELSNLIQIFPDTIGTHKIKIIAFDIFEKNNSVDIVLEVFDNLIPETVFSVDILNDYKIVIDASESYDKDQNFGGKIERYRYKIGENYDVVHDLPIMNYQFTGAGNYKIQVSVQDNDGAWSKIKSETIKID